MRGLVESSLGVGLAVVSGLLLLALLAELYYIFWWKKKKKQHQHQHQHQLPCNSSSNSYAYASKLLPCFKYYFKSTTPAPDADADADADASRRAPAPAPTPAVGDDAIDAELMRLHGLSGPPRFLFTIKEETREDLESDGARSRKDSRGRSLGDLLHCAESPLLTPLSSPPLLGLGKVGIAKSFVHFDSLKKLGWNPLFESSHSSPPPKFRFLQEAEEKLRLQLQLQLQLQSQGRIGILEGSRAGATGEQESEERTSGPVTVAVTPLPSSLSSIEPQK